MAKPVAGHAFVVKKCLSALGIGCVIEFLVLILAVFHGFWN